MRRTPILSDSKKSSSSPSPITGQSIVKMVAKCVFLLLIFPVTLMLVAFRLKPAIVHWIKGVSNNPAVDRVPTPLHTPLQGAAFRLDTTSRAAIEEEVAIGEGFLPDNTSEHVNFNDFGNFLINFAREASFREEFTEEFVNSGQMGGVFDVTQAATSSLMLRFKQCLECDISLDDKKAIFGATLDMVQLFPKLLEGAASIACMCTMSDKLLAIVEGEGSVQTYLRDLVSSMLRGALNSLRVYIPHTHFSSADPKIDIPREVAIYCRDLPPDENENFLQQQRIGVLLEKYSNIPCFQHVIQQLFEAEFAERDLPIHDQLEYALQNLLGVVRNQYLVDSHIAAIQGIINEKCKELLLLPIFHKTPGIQHNCYDFPIDAFSIKTLTTVNLSNKAKLLSDHDKAKLLSDHDKAKLLSDHEKLQNLVTSVRTRSVSRHKEKVEGLFRITMRSYSHSKLDIYLHTNRENAKPWHKFFFFLDQYLSDSSKGLDLVLDPLFEEIKDACNAGCRVQQEAYMDRWCAKLIIATAEGTDTNRAFAEQIGCSSLHLFFYLRLLREYVLQGLTEEFGNSGYESVDFYGAMLTSLGWGSVYSYFYKEHGGLRAQYPRMFEEVEKMPQKLLEAALNHLTVEPSTMPDQADITIHAEICSWIDTLAGKTTLFGDFYTDAAKRQLAPHTVILYFIKHKMLDIDSTKLGHLNEQTCAYLMEGRLML